MPFVHMVRSNRLEAQGAQHGDAANAEHDLLAQSIPVVPTIEVVGQRPVLGRVFGNLGVQKQNRHDVPGLTPQIVAPCLDLYQVIGHGDHDSHRQEGEELFGGPGRFALGLVPDLVQLLPEISATMKQGHRDHGDAEVGGCPQGVPREDPQSATVGMHRGIDADFHGKIGNGGFFVRQCRETEHGQRPGPARVERT